MTEPVGTSCRPVSAGRFDDDVASERVCIPASNTSRCNCDNSCMCASPPPGWSSCCICCCGSAPPCPRPSCRWWSPERCRKTLDDDAMHHRRAAESTWTRRPRSRRAMRAAYRCPRSFVAPTRPSRSPVGPPRSPGERLLHS